MNTEKPFNEGLFVQELTQFQDKLFAYIMINVQNREAALDVRQEVNVLLWDRRHDFEQGTNFQAWARSMAYYQILAYHRDKGRDKHVFCDELMERLGAVSERKAEQFSDRMAALNACLATLPENQKWLMEQRYSLNCSIKKIAEVTGKSKGNTAIIIHRIRRTLRSCIRARIFTEGGATA